MDRANQDVVVEAIHPTQEPTAVITGRNEVLEQVPRGGVVAADQPPGGRGGLGLAPSDRLHEVAQIRLQRAVTCTHEAPAVVVPSPQGLPAPGRMCHSSFTSPAGERVQQQIQARPQETMVEST